LYEGHVQGDPPTLPPLPIQYADYALWQRSWLQGAALEAQLDYWRTQLADTPELLALPTDFPRPSVQSFAGAAITFSIAPEVRRGLEQLCQSEGLTLYMALLAAFQALLARYSGQEDIVVGSPIANRTQPEVEGLIGFFVNTLAIRTDLR